MCMPSLKTSEKLEVISCKNENCNMLNTVIAEPHLGRDSFKTFASADALCVADLKRRIGKFLGCLNWDLSWVSIGPADQGNPHEVSMAGKVFR